MGTFLKWATILLVQAYALGAAAPALSQQYPARSIADPVGSTPEELERVVRAELKRWAAVIHEAGIKRE